MISSAGEFRVPTEFSPALKRSMLDLVWRFRKDKSRRFPDDIERDFDAAWAHCLGLESKSAVLCSKRTKVRT